MSWTCPPKTVVVGVDFGEASARAVAVAQVIATTFGARIRAVHAERFEPPPYFTLEQIARLEAERRTTLAATADHLARFVGASTPRVDITVLDEPPVDALMDASAGADLVVVGTHGRRGPGRWWLGSVAERVIRSVAVPVLVVRAATSAPQDVFARIAVVGDAGSSSPALQCAGQLARIAGGTVTTVGSAVHCDPRRLNDASLVVSGAGFERHFWRLADDVATVLNACERPVLFVPGNG
jgi:nucleotide-binding universal stress UspA family protein